MKFERNRKYTTIAIYAFIVIAASILFLELVRNVGNITGWFQSIAGYLLPVTYGFIIAFLLNPLMRLYDDRFLPWLSKDKLKPKLRRGLAIFMTYFTALIFIVLFLILVIPQINKSITLIAENMTGYMKLVNGMYRDFTKSLSDYQILQDSDANEILQNLAGSVLSALQGMLESLNELLNDIPPYLVNMGVRLSSGVINVVVGIIISIYFLADREKLFAQTRKVAHAIFPDRTYHLLYDLALESNRVFNGFIVGKIIDSIIIGILCFIGMSLLRMPNAMLVSVIIGVTNVIPYFGPFIGAIPGFLLVFIGGPNGPLQSLFFLVFILVLQQFDGNILGPKILGDSTGLSAFWVIFSIMLFSGMFGIMGMFIGVPLFAVFYSVCKRFMAFLLEKKNKSPDTRDYASPKNPLIK